MKKHWAKRAMGGTCAIGLSTALFGAQGCLDRPVVPIPPESSGVSFEKLRVSRVEKLDLLLVVDNSASMKDKQAELGRRIPELIHALTDPATDPVTGTPTNPVVDVHVAVISSSLGSHGTPACDPGLSNPNSDDRGHLMPRAAISSGTGFRYDATAKDAVPTACPSTTAASALSWVFDPAKEDSTALFAGSAGAADLETATSCVVQSVEQDGCGYEATLEAMYHFLVDPAPYATAKATCGGAGCSGAIQVEGIDDAILAQRAAFLRPDSLLAVVILTDENDASLKPAGQNWLPWAFPKGAMQRGWAGCADVPDDFEPQTDADFTRLAGELRCKSCFADGSDPGCAAKWSSDPRNHDVDATNLRAFHQLQRFGYDFLWPRQRYVDAFTKTKVLGSNGELGVNPIFAGGYRNQDLVVVAGIVGVPKVLVSDDAGNPKALTEDDWRKIIGPVGARDPHMIESIAPRAGIAKFAGDRAIDPVNGGDRDVEDGGDLQYACIAKRAPDATGGDDCAGGASGNPLCDGSGAQPYFKAYPGLRPLRVIHDLGPSGFVASICNDTFAPAIRGITARLKAAIDGQCVRSSLTAQADGAVNCLILEAMRGDTQVGKRCEEIGVGLCTPGAGPCRLAGTDYPPISAEAAAAQLALPITVVNDDGSAETATTTAIEEGGSVYVVGRDGRKHLVCEVMQLAGGRVPQATTDACIHDDAWTPATDGGWCYSTDDAVKGKSCTQLGAPGTIRFFGGAKPRNGSEVFTMCVQ